MLRAVVALLLSLPFVLVPLQRTVLAHHTFVTKYDAKRQVTVSGTITSVSYTNPHIFFDLTGTSKSGGAVTWRIETEGILAARSKGLTDAVLKEGARARVTGWLARDGGGEIGLKTITIAGKRTISMRKTAR